MKKRKKKILVWGVIGVIVIIGVCIYLFFINGKNTNGQIKKYVSSYVGDLYLDNSDKIYFRLSDELRNDDNYSVIVKSENSQISDNDNKEISVLALSNTSISEINYFKNGQAGYGYFTILSNQTLYVISDEKIENEYKVEMIKINGNFKSVGVNDAPSVYAIDINDNMIYIDDVI